MQNPQIYTTLKIVIWSQCCSDVDATTSKLQCCFNVVWTLDSEFNSIPWMLYWQLCGDVEIATSNLQRLLNVNLATLIYSAIVQCNDFHGSWMKLIRFKNLRVFTILLATVQLIEVSREKTTQVLVTKLWFFCFISVQTFNSYVKSLVLFSGVLGIFGSSGTQPRETFLYSEVF